MPNRHRGQPGLAEPIPSGKVAIPRLGRREDDAPTAHDKSRVDTACTNCRKKKIKCNGERPKCRHCEEHKAPCEYSTGRKDKLKIATDQNTGLIELLKDISLRACDDDKEAIRNALRDVTADKIAVDTSLNDNGKRPKTDASPRPDMEHERRHTEELSSSGDVPQQELQKEDLLRSQESRATGYVGSISDVQWLRSLRCSTEDTRRKGSLRPYFINRDHPGTHEQSWAGNRSPLLNIDQVSPVTESTYYLDNEKIDVDDAVNAYKLPPADMAEKLFDSYMKTVNTSFPVLPKSFEDQFRQYYDARRHDQPFRVKDNWRAILNLVFAIGARYTHLITEERQADSSDNLSYMSRAMRLLEGNAIATLVDPPDLLSIQATSLLSIYYLAIGHVSRAWIAIGSAIRSALAVGLHLRNDDPEASVHKKETLKRIWWGLHSIESLLSAMTGRPDVLSDANCTVPLPALLLEEQSSNSSLRRGSGAMRASVTLSPASPRSPLSSGSKSASPAQRIAGFFLDARVRISRLTQKVLLTLYLPRTVSRPWEQVQNSVSKLMVELEEWAFVALPDKALDFTRTPESDDHREQMLLRFHYYSTKLLITRPCLCRIEYRQKRSIKESEAFDQTTAQACVQAAIGMSMLFPEQPDLKYMYRNGPWWSLVHHIMQALAVLLLEISYRGKYEQEDSEDLNNHVNKLIQWLHAMRTTNPIADRALGVVSDIVEKGDPVIFGDIAQRLPRKAPVISAGTKYFNHPYLQSNLDIPTEPTLRFQPNEWDPIEWQYLDTQPEQRTSPFNISPLQQPTGMFALKSAMFMSSNSSPTDIYGNPALPGFSRANTAFKGGEGSSSL